MVPALIAPNPPVFPSKSAPVQLQWACSLDDVDAWESAWRDLDSRVGNPLTQFNWIRTSLSAFASDAVPQVVAAFRSDQLVALAPLVSRRVHGIRRLSLAGVNEVFEPGDMVWTDERAMERLVSVLARSGSPLVLDRVGADSLSVQKLKRAYRGRAVIITRPQATCSFIALDETWLEPEQHLNSGRRSDLRRARRKAEQLGPVTTEIHTPDLNELPQLLDLAFDVEAKSCEGQDGRALVNDAHRAVFYRHYAQTACVEGVLRICFLRIGDHVAAMQLAVEQGGGFWLLKVGYDPHFSACSPGLLLMRDTIRYAVEAGLENYEFLGRDVSWTEMWTNTEHPYVSVRVYPIGVRGMAALAADAFAAAVRKWRKRQCKF